MITGEMVRQHWNTHDWEPGELPICKKCGKSPIGLGMWGDQDWRRENTGWMKPCTGGQNDTGRTGQTSCYRVGRAF